MSDQWYKDLVAGAKREKEEKIQKDKEVLSALTREVHSRFDKRQKELNRIAKAISERDKDQAERDLEIEHKRQFKELEKKWETNRNYHTKESIEKKNTLVGFVKELTDKG